MVSDGDLGCVVIRGRRRMVAVHRSTEAAARIRRIADDAEQTTAAFALGPGASAYAAVAGAGTEAVQHAARLVAERRGGRWRGDTGVATPDSLVESTPPDLDPAQIVADFLAMWPHTGELEICAEAHTSSEHRLFVPARGEPVREVVQTGAAVVDILRAGVPIADSDIAWTGTAVPDIAALAERIDRAVHRGHAPHRHPVPARVQLLLLDGSAGPFLHEVCGHLVESTRQRPSLLAGHEARAVAAEILTVADDPGIPGGFGAHRYTMLGSPARRRALLDEGRLVGLLADTPDGPWRAEDARHHPRPRMSHLTVEPARTAEQLDEAIGAATVPVIEVHRLGFGSLDHRDGTVVLEVKDATLCDGSRTHRLEPFLVTAEARHILREVRAVGCAAGVRTWSAYCLATSGRLPVGATVPSLLTGPLTTLPHRSLGALHAAASSDR